MIHGYYERARQCLRVLGHSRLEGAQRRCFEPLELQMGQYLKTVAWLDLLCFVHGRPSWCSSFWLDHLSLCRELRSRRRPHTSSTRPLVGALRDLAEDICCLDSIWSFHRPKVQRRGSHLTPLLLSIAQSLPGASSRNSMRSKLFHHRHLDCVCSKSWRCGLKFARRFTWEVNPFVRMSRFYFPRYQGQVSATFGP